jgi:hypothetical protein
MPDGRRNPCHGNFEMYEKVGLRVLRYTWLNFDLLSAIALLVAGFAVLLL